MRLKLSSYLLIIVCIMCFHSPAFSQIKFEDTNLLPIDPHVKMGTLDNGVTFYIRKNTEPKNRASLYLVVKAGSLLEKEKQRGLAHFMEHMSFNGTKHFPKNELIDYLQKSGIKFGADLNAYTGFDETVYQLPIPTDNPEILKNGLQILRDWAQDATLDPAEIERERGVVLEEKRLRLGVQQRIQDQILPIMLNGSRYAQRMPIGTDEVLKNFTPAVIGSFYKDWYMPDLQAVIVVGDIDPVKIETEVRHLFGDLKRPKQPKKRLSYDIVLDGRNKFKVVTDPELSETTVQVLIKHKERSYKTESDFKAGLIRTVFSGMLSERLAEATKHTDAPFVALQGSYSEIMGGLEALSITLTPRRDQLEIGFKSAWKEIESIRRLGFTDTEFGRMKAQVLSQVDAAFREKDKQTSAALADQYKLHFLKGTAAPGIEAEFELVNRLLPEITLADVNEMAKIMIKPKDRDIIITAPASAKSKLPLQATVYQWISEVNNGQVKPYYETKTPSGLLSKLPASGSVINEKHIPELGVFEWTLSNGAKVVLKPTNFMNDEIAFLALSKGGSSLYKDAEYESAANAAGIVASFGLGEHDQISLPKLLNGKQVGVQPFIAERVEGLQGGSSVKDLGTAMELIHLYFTSARKDTALFRKIIQNSAQQISGRYTDPNAIFADTIAAVLGEYNPRRTGPTLAKLNSIKLDEVLRIYKERFANAGDFSFFFVGSFDKDSLKRNVEQYIASLPAVGGKEKSKDLGIRIPSGKIAKTLEAGKEDKASVRLVFSGDYSYNTQNNLLLAALQEILQYRLTERLREVEGGVYTPSAQVEKAKFPVSTYSFTISFGCAPANVEKLISASLDEIRKLKVSGVLASDLQKFKAEQFRQNELAEKNNGFWLNYLSGQYLEEEDPKAFLYFNSEIEKLDTDVLQDAAKKYLRGDNYIRFVLKPKK